MRKLQTVQHQTQEENLPNKLCNKQETSAIFFQSEEWTRYEAWVLQDFLSLREDKFIQWNVITKRLKTTELLLILTCVLWLQSNKKPSHSPVTRRKQASDIAETPIKRCKIAFKAPDVNRWKYKPLQGGIKRRAMHCQPLFFYKEKKKQKTFCLNTPT